MIVAAPAHHLEAVACKQPNSERGAKTAAGVSGGD